MDIGLFLGAGFYGYPTTKALKEELSKSIPASPNNIEYAFVVGYPLMNIFYIVCTILFGDAGIDFDNSSFNAYP